MLTTLTETVGKLPSRSDGKPKQVIIYGHSMAGAALSVLTGNGKQQTARPTSASTASAIMPNATPGKLVDAASNYQSYLPVPSRRRRDSSSPRPRRKGRCL